MTSKIDTMTSDTGTMTSDTGIPQMPQMPAVTYTVTYGNHTMTTAVHPLILDRYWSGFVIQLNPFNSVITISRNVMEYFDAGAIQLLLQKFTYVNPIPHESAVQDIADARPDA